MSVPTLDYVHYKKPVRAATDGTSIDLTSTSDPGSIDGVTLSDGDRVLLKNQSTGSENGIYNAVTATDPSTWERAFDADKDDLVNGGMVVPISEGSNNGNKTFQVTTNDPITLGTTSLSFAEAGGSGSSGGGFIKTETTTQTGDAEKQVQEIKLPDEDGSHFVEAILTAQANDGSQEYVAEHLFKKSFRKKGGSIQDVKDYSDDPSVTNRSGALFGDSDFKLRGDGSGNAELVGGSPLVFNTISAQTNTSKDVSGATGISNSDADDIGCDTGPNGQIHLCYYDGSDLVYLAPDGMTEVIFSGKQTAGRDSTELVVDGSGDIHVAFAEDPDLKYAKRESGSWGSVETAYTSSSSVLGASLDVDENNIPHIAFEDSNDNLQYADRDGGSWSNTTLNSSAIWYSPTIRVVDSSKIGVVAADGTNSNVDIYVGSSGMSSPSSASISPNTGNDPLAADLSWDGAQWVISWFREDPAAYVAEGTISGGFTTTELSSYGSGIMSHEGTLVISPEDGYSRVCVMGDTSGTDPYDVVLYTNSGGSWAKDSVLYTLGGNWSASAKGERFMTITDGGSGAQDAVSIEHQESVSTTITWRGKSLQ